MTSPVALTFDTFYHVFNRGNNRENIFFNVSNYSFFLRLYARYISPIADTWAYCLLRNHFHLFLKIKTEDELVNTLGISTKEYIRLLHTPSRHFSNFFNAYSKTINNTYHRTGSLFQHPFKRIAVSDRQYFCRVIAYIHQNPQRHGLVSDFREWPYSSFHAYRAKEGVDVTGKVIPLFYQDVREYRKFHLRKSYLGTIIPLLIDDLS
jgi:putative transposase